VRRRIDQVDTGTSPYQIRGSTSAGSKSIEGRGPPLKVALQESGNGEVFALAVQDR